MKKLSGSILNPLFNLYNFVLFMLDDSQKSITSRFDFIDGYRGFCALVVAIHHIVLFHRSTGDLKIFVKAGFYIGVAGFFVLSAFLLTYKMTKELDKSQNWTEVKHIISKYFIRRIFRIYIPYMFFVTCVTFGPTIVKGTYKEYNTWLNLALLQPTLGNHLWTIPVEIKYYFLIPVICVIFKLSGKHWLSVSFFSIGLMYYLYQTYLYYLMADSNIHASKLYVRFPIFYSGSLVAFFYYKYEKWENNLKIILTKRFSRFVFCICSYLMAFYGITHFSPYYNPNLNMYNDSLHPGIKFSFLLFVMLIGAPNDFTRLFGDNFVLKKFGKYSFGIYLWHPMCIFAIKYYEIERQLDAVIVVLILSYFCGLFFYYLIENPMMKLGNYFVQRKNKDLTWIQTSNA